MLGNGMDTVYRLLTSTSGYRRSQFMLDTSFEHFHFIPNDMQGEVLLKLLVNPKMAAKLNQLLLSDQNRHGRDLPMEYDAVDQDDTPTILAYNFVMHRINRFNTGLNVYGKSGNPICFDFQIPVLEQYLTANIRFSSIDLSKFRKGFLHEP